MLILNQWLAIVVVCLMLLRRLSLIVAIEIFALIVYLLRVDDVVLLVVIVWPGTGALCDTLLRK